MGRPWLRDTTAGMICVTCQKYGSAITENKKNQFVKGCKSYKLDSVVKHEKSQQHVTNTLAANARTQEAGTSKAEQIIQNLNKDIIEKLSIMFRTCHALVLHDRPISDYIRSCRLDELKGLHIGKTYTSRPSAKEFMKYIASVEFNRVSDMIKKSQYFCLIGDGSTDSAVNEQEIWYVRTSVGGSISVFFIGIATLDKANAENITSAIKELISVNLQIEWTEFAKKLVCLACDGASVMTGCRGGVGALLRHDAPCMITLHCMAHRLELALKDVAKKVKLYETVNSILISLYYFYHNSPLNHGMLKRSYQAFKEEKDGQLLIPARAGGTRWISHQIRAINSILKSYKYIVAHLEQVGKYILFIRLHNQIR